MYDKSTVNTSSVYVSVTFISNTAAFQFVPLFYSKLVVLLSTISKIDTKTNEEMSVTYHLST